MAGCGVSEASYNALVTVMLRLLACPLNFLLTFQHFYAFMRLILPFLPQFGFSNQNVVAYCVHSGC